MIQMKRNKQSSGRYNCNVLLLLFRYCSRIIFLCSCWNFYIKVIVEFIRDDNGNSNQGGHRNIMHTLRRQEQEQNQQMSRSSVRLNNTNNNSNSRDTTNGNNQSNDTSQHRLRVLYCITSMNELDTGRRDTIEGYDRFSKIIIPVVRESVQSLREEFDTIDIFFICHYKLTKERYNELQRSIGSNNNNNNQQVRLFVWDDATPLGYASEDELVSNDQHRTQQQQPRLIQPITRALARQHRYIIKDHFLNFDVFVNFEDDMLIRQQHIRHYIDISNEITALRQSAPERLYHPTSKHEIEREQMHKTNDNNNDNSTQLGAPIDAQEAFHLFYGTMTEKALSRIIPGFIRVEVVASSDFQRKQSKKNIYRQIPVDYSYYNATTTSRIDASICCHLSEQTMIENQNLMTNPTSDQLHYWETSIEALGVRKMPSNANYVTATATTTNSTNVNSSVPPETKSTRSSNLLDWVVLQNCNSDEKYIPDARYIIGDYWSGNDILQNTDGDVTNYFGDIKRPARTQGKYCSNQGGWIGLQKQIFEWNFRWCMGGFLPPYDLPYYLQDGLNQRNVEYWSGGIQIAGVNGCNLQRILTLDPDGFSKHLLYHTANNKQRSTQLRRQYSSRSINEFWGQLNTVKKNAERQMMMGLEQQHQQ